MWWVLVLALLQPTCSGSFGQLPVVERLHYRVVDATSQAIRIYHEFSRFDCLVGHIRRNPEAGLRIISNRHYGIGRHVKCIVWDFAGQTDQYTYFITQGQRFVRQQIEFLADIDEGREVFSQKIWIGGARQELDAANNISREGGALANIFDMQPARYMQMTLRNAGWASPLYSNCNPRSQFVKRRLSLSSVGLLSSAYGNPCLFVCNRCGFHHFSAGLSGFACPTSRAVSVVDRSSQKHRAEHANSHDPPREVGHFLLRYKILLGPVFITIGLLLFVWSLAYASRGGGPLETPKRALQRLRKP
jgi:hypothetical protein